MRLIINRQYQEPPPGASYGPQFKFRALLELTPEEKELVDNYKLGSHVLTRSQRGATTLGAVIAGTVEGTFALDVTMGNEQALRDAVAQLPSMLDYCRSFGNDIFLEHSSPATS